MLGIILSHQELLAGSMDQSQASWLTWEREDQYLLNTTNPEKTLIERLGEILDKARNTSWFSGSAEHPCPILVSTAVHEDVTELKLAINAALKNMGVEDFRLVHTELMVWSFMSGIDALPKAGDKAFILESLGKAAMLYEVETRKGVELPSTAETGAKYLFRAEKTSRRKLQGVGQESGREKVLARLMKEFSSAGITLDAETQTSLADQITHQPLPDSFSLSREKGKVVLQAEASFTADELSEMMLGDFQSLRPQLKADVIEQAGVKEVWLMGEYFHHPTFISFLKEECNLGSRVREMESGDHQEVFAISLNGLEKRYALIQEAEGDKAEAEQKRREAEEKKAAIAAELKIKDERDQLLQEIKDTCTDPAKREEYEGKFVSRGESLGIPDLVIKWNITEALSRVELVQVGEEIGLDLPEKTPTDVEQHQSVADENHQSREKQEEEAVAIETKPTTVQDKQPVEKQPEPAKAATKPEQTSSRDEQKEKAGKASPEPAKTSPEPAKVSPEPVVAKTKKEAAPTPAKKAEKQPEPVLEPVGAGAGVAVAAVKEKVATKPSKKRDQVSLEEIFSFKGDLSDAEFISRKATFHQDSDVKLVRILSSDYIANGEAIGNFRKVYDKELAYFGQMSEISESRDGMYYYRKYIERQTLRDFAKRTGLANKKSIEELSSGDLKFILTLLKEVQELPVSHGNITADNILIINKRKWNLSKDLEIKFVNFHSQDTTEEISIAQAHKALGDVIGEKVYLEFKEKFQL